MSLVQRLARFALWFFARETMRALASWTVTRSSSVLKSDQPEKPPYTPAGSWFNPIRERSRAQVRFSHSGVGTP
jgi:hypothetical protein